jgi:nicotinate-nucleotide adenylyltransferase
VRNGSGERAVVGVLGGTFDPVHLGHLGVAEIVLGSFRLGRLLLLPCDRPPHKTRRTISPAADRVRMLELAVEGRAGLEVSTIEIARGGISYTIETLRHLREVDRVDPLFVVGVDALSELPTWRECDRLTAEFDLVVVDRPGGSVEEAMRALGAGHAGRIVGAPAAGEPAGGARVGRGGRIFHLPVPPCDVSSREVRRRAAAGLPLDGLVPPPVARYILERGLYREEAAR